MMLYVHRVLAVLIIASGSKGSQNGRNAKADINADHTGGGGETILAAFLGKASWLPERSRAYLKWHNQAHTLNARGDASG